MLPNSKSWELQFQPHKRFCTTCLSFILVHCIALVRLLIIKKIHTCSMQVQVCTAKYLPVVFSGIFQDVLLFELFHKNIPNPLLFSFKSAQKFSRQNSPVRKKTVPASHSTERAIRCFPDRSTTNQCAPWPENYLRWGTRA